jgi:hypothetical protein
MEVPGSGNQSLLSAVTPISILSDDILSRVFKHLTVEFAGADSASNSSVKTFAWYRKTLPLVCKHWAKIHASPSSLWEAIHVEVEKEIAAQRRPRLEASVSGQSPIRDGPSTRRSLGPIMRVSSEAVLQWMRKRGRKTESLYLNFENINHDFTSRDFEDLLNCVRPCLKLLHLKNSPGAMPYSTSSDVLVRLHGKPHLTATRCFYVHQNWTRIGT